MSHRSAAHPPALAFAATTLEEQMSNPHDPGLIYACVAVGADREVQVGPIPSWEEALAVEEVMRERIAELISAEDLIREVDGTIAGMEHWDLLEDEVRREGHARHLRRRREHDE
jgi:hypothetical protein